ncbi:MAG: hypothetical protein H6733_07790 [Alphaproteobacteria bacterium]|nr:hypothetical protein [Alphaproteobacteria bacterium]
MASYLTTIGDTKVLLEAPVGSAFAKSDIEVAPDPHRAIINMIDTMRTLVSFMGTEVGPVLRKTGASLEVSFAVRADHQGLVMISESAQAGQFQVSVKWPAMRPAPPTKAPPALPQHDQD